MRSLLLTFWWKTPPRAPGWRGPPRRWWVRRSAWADCRAASRVVRSSSSVRVSPVSAGWDSGSMRVARAGRRSLSAKASRASGVVNLIGATPGSCPWSSRISRVSISTRSPMQVAVTSSRSASTFMEQTCRW